MVNHFSRLHLLLTIIFFLMLSACGKDPLSKESTKAYVPTTQVVTEQAPTVTPTPEPPGSGANPVVMGMVYEDKSAQEPAAYEFVQYLADQTGLVFKIQPYHDYNELLTAMNVGDASFAWLHPLTYIYADRNEIASVGFLAKNYGVFSYGSQFLVRSDSDFNIYFDPRTNLTTADRYTALRQFENKRPCYLDEESIAGYVVPTGLTNQVNLKIAPPTFQQSSTSVIRAVYAGGICDFGVTFALSGDPRTSSVLQSDLPDVMQKVLVVWRSEAVIPTLNLSYATLINPNVKLLLSSSVLTFSELPQGPDILSKMTKYEIEALKPATNDDYAALVQLVTASGINLSDYLGK